VSFHCISSEVQVQLMLFLLLCYKFISDAIPVCLSILNTWSGDENQVWQPGKSTVLAVLVSIQAMILGAPLPWLNEPGLEAQGETPQAFEHKRIIQIKTIKYAMIAWLMKIMPSDGKVEPDVWNDIVEEYWKCNGKLVLETVEQWSLENPHIKSYRKDAMHYMGILTAADLDITPNPIPLKTNVKGKTENLALKLQELVLLESKRRAKMAEKGLSKGTDGGGFSGLKRLSRTEVLADGTSINKSSLKISAENAAGESRNGKRKESASTESEKAQKGGSKRQKTTKAKKDGAYVSSSEDDMEGLLLQQGKPQKYLNDPRGDSVFDATEKWIYTGSRSLKEIRAVCHQFNLTPARSINDSIARLEEHINNATDANNELALKYGKRVN
jgi:hypothetical protein